MALLNTTNELLTSGWPGGLRVTGTDL